MLLPLLLVTLSQTNAITIRSGLAIGDVLQGGRVPFPQDAVQSLIVEGDWKEPKEGDEVTAPNGQKRRWTLLQAKQDGVFEGRQLSGGYVYAKVDVDQAGPMLLSAAGDSLVYINGELHTGDPYSYGYLKIPFMAKKGQNTFLFSCGRGRLQASVEKVDKPAGLNLGDLTLPDILVGDTSELSGAVPVLNCEEKESRELRITAQVGTGQERSMPVPAMLPMSLRKSAFYIKPDKLEAGDQKLTLRLYRGNDKIDEQTTNIRVRKPTEHYKRTFISNIDGSVQYFAVTPSLQPDPSNALILSVHGASVEALNQAQAYKPKDWCTLVAATNRRPYGFDWEDWGRTDGMEVLSVAKAMFPHNPSRVILTGHSMGGHGTWQLGVTYPNEWAAIGPSAGWVSFWSYAGGWVPRDPGPVENMLRRSVNSSDTLLMQRNLLRPDIYILHGDKDDNVPVTEARFMKDVLTKMGKSFEYHEQPGAGHWWGDECVDWPPMFELFKKARIPGSAAPVDFTTVNPRVSATCGAFTIVQQIRPLEPSRVTSTLVNGTWNIETENVQTLTISKAELGAPFTWSGAVVQVESSTDAVTITKEAAPSTAKAQKSPDVGGPFKMAFQNRFALVVATHGTKEENAWALAKAKFDAETWYYRGNGSVGIYTDDKVPSNRSLILYGNADTNSAWRLIKDAPLQVKRNRVSLDGRTFDGDDFAAMFLYPASGRMIGVVAPTGVKGGKLLDRMPYFTSGVAYPDWTIASTSTLQNGTKGVIGCGFFGNDWSYSADNAAWR